MLGKHIDPDYYPKDNLIKLFIGQLVRVEAQGLVLGDQSKGSGKGDMGKGDMGDSDKDSDKSKSKSEYDDDDDKPTPELYDISTPTPSTTEESLWKMTNVQLRKLLPGKRGVSKFRKEQLAELVIASKSKTTGSD